MSIWLFPILFVFVAMATRKDIAVYAASASIIGALIYSQEHWYLESTVMAFSATNCALALLSAYHYKVYKHDLGLVSAVIATVAVFNNLSQVILFTEFSQWISEALAWILLLCITVMPGRKGWINDLVMDCLSVCGICVRHHGGKRHTGGRH